MKAKTELVVGSADKNVGLKFLLFYFCKLRFSLLVVLIM